MGRTIITFFLRELGNFLRYDAFLVGISLSVADPDLELKGGGLDLLALSAIFPSVISSFFTPKKGARAPPLDPQLEWLVHDFFRIKHRTWIPGPGYGSHCILITDIILFTAVFGVQDHPLPPSNKKWLQRVVDLNLI